MTIQTSKNIRAIALTLALLLAACMANAGDYQWVKRTYTWRSNGMMRTATVPIFGDEISIRCTSPAKSRVKITLFDESDDAGKKAPEVIVDSPHLRGTSSTTVKNVSKISLLIESRGDCLVEIDQYLESVGEWRLRSWLQKRNSLSPKKLAVWTGEAQQTIEYQPKQACSRMVFTQRSSGTSEIIATAQNGEVLFRKYVNSPGVQAIGWIHTSEPVKFDVQGAVGTTWLLEITEE